MTESVLHTQILRAVYAVLIPLAKTLLRAGITYREFDELARLALVTAASDEYGLRGRPTNNSRIAAMTGIPRKEVSKLRAERSALEDVPRSELSPLGDVLHRWYTDPVYLDEHGSPLVLPPDGDHPSFSELARECAGDLPIGAIRVELIRTGAVRQEPGGALRVLRRVAIPDGIDDRLITSFSFNLFCLASTIAHNSNPARKGEARIERFVQSDHLSQTAKRKFRLIAHRRIERFTEELDDVFSTAESDERKDQGRVGVGVYYYEDD